MLKFLPPKIFNAYSNWVSAEFKKITINIFLEKLFMKHNSHQWASKVQSCKKSKKITWQKVASQMCSCNFQDGVIRYKSTAPFGFASMVKVAFRPQTIQEYNSLMAKCVPFSTVGTLIHIIWVPELLTRVLCMIESDYFISFRAASDLVKILLQMSQTFSLLFRDKIRTIYDNWFIFLFQRFF